MPNVLDLFNQDPAEKAKTAAKGDALSEGQESAMNQYDYEAAGKEKKQKGYSLEGNLASGDPEQEQLNQNTQMAEKQFGATSLKNAENRYEDPTSWSPEYAMKSFFPEAGDSILRGVGNHLLKGTGDILQVAGGYLGDKTVSDGTWFSRALQESGSDMAEKFKTYMPEELRAENLTWGSLTNPKFWSTHVAEMVPQLAEFILLSKGGSAVARNLAGRVAKSAVKKGVIANATKTALGSEIVMSGSGIGKLATRHGLSKLGEGLVGAVGGGVTGNLFSGMLNAADVVNSNKGETYTNEQGEEVPLYSEEQLQQMASGTMGNNAQWMLMDIASWGMTYGGGWKALKGMTKGKKLFDAGQQANITSKMFQYNISPIVQNLGKLAGTASMEGIEETYQETFEEWAKMRAKSKVTGEPMKHESFMDFYNSDENKATKVISFAVGALGGAVFNASSLINKSAEESLRVYDKATNLTEIVKKQGTDNELEWNEYYKRQQIADIVIDEGTEEEAFHEFMANMVKNESVNPEEMERYNEMYEGFKDVKRKAKNLNVKGLSALMYNNSKEKYFNSKIAEFEALAKDNIATIKEQGHSTADENELINREKSLFKKRLKAASIGSAEAKQNQLNLIMGKKASALEVVMSMDQYGNEIIEAGFTAQQEKDFTGEDKYYKDGNFKSEKESAAYEKSKEPSGVSISSLGSKTKKLYNDIVNAITGKADGEETTDTSILDDMGEDTSTEVDQEVEEQTETNNTLSEDELKSVEEEFGVYVEAREDGYEAQSQDDAPDSLLNRKKANTRLNELLEAKKKTKVQTPEEAEAENSKDDAEVYEAELVAETEALEVFKNTSSGADEIVGDEEYNDFKDGEALMDGTIPAIAKKIYSKKQLSPREDEIKSKNENEILSEIVNIILNEKSNGKKNDTKKLPEPKDLNPTGDQKADSKEYTDFEELDDNFTDEQNEFIKSLVEDNTESDETLDSVRKTQKDKAKKDWNFSKRKRNQNNIEGLDKRSGKDSKQQKINAAIQESNFLEYQAIKNFIYKVRNKINPAVDNFSDNELDNYLNTYNAYNMMGPTDVDKMVAVNHNLKRFFPNKDFPVQALIVRNLYEAIGSQGLAHALVSTIFIDEKVWDQNDIFMHEMSHIFYKLGKDLPIVKELMSAALADKVRVARVKSKYDDYTLYKIKGELYTKQEIQDELNESGYPTDTNALNEMIKTQIELGNFKTVPLSEQIYLKEEVFADMLEKPFAERFDKAFNIKEAKRQKDTKKFWGLLRKKGAEIEADNNIDKLLRTLDTDNQFDNKTSLEDYVFNVFKTVTKGVKMDSYGLDARAAKVNKQRIEDIQEFRERKDRKANDEPILMPKDIEAEKAEMDEYEDQIEDSGVSFFNSDFSKQLKGTTRILKNFGKSYNKALRIKMLRDTKDSVVDRKKQNRELFDKEFFEALMYNLAIENNDSNEFGVMIEKSSIKEVQAFNRYLEKVHPVQKEQILNSMHFVLSNSKHVSGFKNNIKDDGSHVMESSFSHREITKANNVIQKIGYEREAKTESWRNFQEAVMNIYNKKETKGDYYEVIDMLTGSGFVFNKVMEQGYLTFRGNNIPIETLISGIIRKGLIFNKDSQGNPKVDPEQIYYASTEGIRPLVESFIDTNRKFTPFSSVKNAEGNMEPLRITNNHLTKEIDNIIDFLQNGLDGKKPTKEEFLERFSHTALTNKDELGKRYVPNQFLENMYDQFQQGMTPNISQYHGIEDLSNKKGSIFKESTSLEQGIEDFLTFINTSRTKRGKKNKTYLGNMGAFSDSPRKFFMNMKRIDYSEVFEYKNGKRVFALNGKVINSIQNIHSQFYVDQLTHNVDANGKVLKDKPLSEKAQKNNFKREMVQSIKNSIDFFNKNQKELSKLNNAKDLFKNGKLNKQGQEVVAEYVINSIVNGYNVADVFAPSIKGDSIVKRFKMNSSPVMSVKNKNFKIEPIFVADTIEGNSISGSDGGMFISQKSAERLQRLGKGVFDMNGGFKLLNASIEKDNPNFKGKSAYLKGYTTVIDETHPFHKILKAREDKYAAYHLDKYGEEQSMDLSDQTFNHMAIIIPQSADKTNFSKEKFIDDQKDANGETIFDDKTGEPLIEYTDAGMRNTATALSENIDDAMKYQDEMYYAKDGTYMGIDSYNFGPQQLMDKQTEHSNVGVQLVNAIVVNATLNGKMDMVTKIQEKIALQKKKSLQKVLDKIKSGNMEDYKKLINESLNKEDMNQAQRILFEDNGSLMHPYINEIIVNQLAKTIRREGNKLSTPGTYAHQKPDTGYIADGAKVSSRLKGYGTRADGGLIPAEIQLPKHMETKAFKRIRVVIDNAYGKQAIKGGEAGLSPTQRKALEKIRNSSDSSAMDMFLMQNAAIQLAKKYHKVNTDAEAMQFVGTEKNSAGIITGYHMKGQTVIASRVPGHGPSSTGVFEVVSFDQGQGNQTMVSSEFNDITGSDNDGDALFINMKGDKEYADWNEAFDLLTEYWTSKEMKDQVTAKMVFEKETEKVVDAINKQFPKNKEYIFPNSPQQRMVDYDNTMVSKRNVGPVFNIHKITNMLAAYEIAMEKSVSINGNLFTNFKDVKVGNDSRNQQSAILANIILDNSKHGYADDIGLDEHNISQAVLLVNLGVPLVDVGKILNSPAAKLWSELNRNNSSMFHNSKKQSTIKKEIYTTLKIKEPKNVSYKINSEQAHLMSEQAAIIETLTYLSDMNSEIQKISKIMSGHNKIHVNPLVLDKQINDFKEVMNGKLENQVLKLTDAFKSNPDLQNYLDVAEETLKHLEVLNPVYRTSSKTVIKNLIRKIGSEMSVKEIENISNDLENFNTSRLLGLNNTSKAYVQDLLNPDSSSSIYAKLKTYLAPLKKSMDINQDDKIRSVSKLDNSILFSKALNFETSGNVKYISANSQFTNDSFNEEERKAAQKEFEELPAQLRDDLIMYDMIQRGWRGPLSIAPFFGEDTNSMINFSANVDATQKNDLINPEILKTLERTIAIKQSREKNNPFLKIYPQNANIFSVAEMVPHFMSNPEIKNLVAKGQSIYINARKGNQTVLYELEEFTEEEIQDAKTERSEEQQRQRLIEIAKGKFKRVEDKLGKIPAIDIATISDSKVMKPFNSSDTKKADKNLDPLVEATIIFEQLFKNKKGGGVQGLDAREDYDIDLFTKKSPLTYEQFVIAKEYHNLVTENTKKSDHALYVKEKRKANELAKTLTPEVIASKSEEELLNMYTKYGEEDVYAYSVIVTPIVKALSHNLMNSQMSLHKDIKFDGKDISLINAHMMTGSTIPSNHPASQGLARLMEVQYKIFVNEKKKYMSETNKVTDALYKERLGYGGERSIGNTFRRIRDAVFVGRTNVYQKLYGNLIIREEGVTDNGKLVINFKLKPESEIQSDFDRGYLSKAEKDFYDHFKKTTNDLMPKKVKNKQEDYIPHTSMTMLESLSSRGLLGLMANSRNEDEAINDVKMYHTNSEGDKVLMNFSEITDMFKMESAGSGKNDLNKIMEYRKLKSKAQKLLKKGVNESGSKIIFMPVGTETALGFGAINRFANNRSVKSTELPSMDLNKALGDYIHSSLFVHGNSQFKGMEQLQGYIDGVLAFNRDNNLPNMNEHVQKVWKDYFSKGKRQESFMGKKADAVIMGLTRLNLFYSLGFQANMNTGGTYAIGNIMAGKYHNIKDLGGKAWLKGEARYWGLDKGFEGGPQGVLDRFKRNRKIMRNLNFMEINVYDEVNMEKKNGLDAIFTDLALSPMILSEDWIQRTHMLGLLTDEQLDKFDNNGDYKPDALPITNDVLVELEDRVKSSHGRGYQPTDQRAIQLYSWGNMMLQFSRFLPTMFHDRFAKRDINIYGRENIGTLRAVGDMVRNVVNDPKGFVKYRNSLSPAERQKLDSGLKGMAMTAIISLFAAENETANSLLMDSNYYMNHPKLQGKMVPNAIQTTSNLVNSMF